VGVGLDRCRTPHVEMVCALPGEWDYDNRACAYLRCVDMIQLHTKE